MDLKIIATLGTDKESQSFIDKWIHNNELDPFCKEIDLTVIPTSFKRMVNVKLLNYNNEILKLTGSQLQKPEKIESFIKETFKTK